jgi:tetratricopeptide (TPR) repeat protein
MRLFVLLMPLLLVWASPLSLQANAPSIVLQSPALKKVQDDLLAVRFTAAKQELNALQKQQPLNLGIIYWLHYSDYLYLQLTEDPLAYAKFKNAYKTALSTLQKNPVNSPYHLWIQAEILVQNAVISLKFNELTTAAKHLRDAYLLLQKNQKRYPSFTPNLKSMGWIEAMITVVPDNYNWILNVMGMKADMQGGILKLQQFCESTANDIPLLIRMEGVFALAGIEFQLLKQAPAAVERMERFFGKRKDPLSIYLLSTIYYYTGYNEKLLASSLQYTYEKGSTYISLLDFYIGMGLLRKNNADSETFLSYFLQQYMGHSYKATANYALALHYHLQGNKEAAHNQLEACKKNTTLLTEQDKQAHKEAQRPLSSNPSLLRARLYFDGYYLDSALLEIQKSEKHLSVSTLDKTEINYRKARIYHQMGQLDKAIVHYQQCIQVGRNLDRYFANYAALNMGNIYEEKKQTAEAKQWYKEALSGFPSNKEYRNSIHQKAKAGLNRLK